MNKKIGINTAFILFFFACSISIATNPGEIWGDGKPGSTTHEINAARSGGITAVTGPQSWISLLCKFADDSNEPISVDHAQQMYSDPAKGLDAYWQQVSGGMISLPGSTAAGWFSLPSPRSDYVEPSADLSRLAEDCIAAADPTINFADYTGINLFFNGDLDGRAYGGGMLLTLDGINKRWGMVWAPVWAYSNEGNIAHEMGHAFGLPHSSGNYGFIYDNFWDVMSRATLCNPEDPEFGCTGQSLNAYQKDRLGWIPDYQKILVPQGSSLSLSLQRLNQPQTTDALMVKIPIQNSEDHYTVESRMKTGVDSQLPGEGVIIHEVVESHSIPAHVLDVDGNYNTGDAGAIWIPGESFVDETNGIAISVISQQDQAFQILVSNNPSSLMAIASADATTGFAPMSIQFNGYALGGAGRASYEWDFGDGTAMSIEQNPVHVFQAPGTYGVTLKVTDSAIQQSIDQHLMISVGMNALYWDNFENGSIEDWNITGGSWSVEEGALHAAGKGDALAPFDGCSECSVEASMKIVAPGGRASLLGWYQDKHTFVELRMMADKQTWIFRQIVQGTAVATARIRMTILPGAFYDVKIRFASGNFSVFINDTLLGFVATPYIPSGKAGFRTMPAHGISGAAFDGLRIDR